MKITDSKKVPGLINDGNITVGTRLYSVDGIFEIIKINYYDTFPLVAQEVFSYDYEKDCECDDYLGGFELYWTYSDLVGMEL